MHLLRVGLIGCFCGLSACFAVGQQAFYVSPDGSDQNPGTETAPFRTIAKARDSVRPLLTPEQAGDITVYLSGGRYEQAGTLHFGPSDSGQLGHAVVYKAMDGETPLISAGRTVKGWEKDADGRWRAPSPVRDFRQLYVNGVRAQRARGVCPEGMERFGALEYIDADAGYIMPDGAMSAWKHPEAIEAGFYTSWSHIICRVDAITTQEDDGRSVLHMAKPWFYLASKKEGRPAEMPDYFENALELLDEPGEWYLDREAEVIYYLPRDGEDMTTAEVRVPGLDVLIEVEGKADNPVQNLHFEGLTFAEAGWLTPNRIGHPDIQANFIITPGNLYERDGSHTNVHNEYSKSPANIALRYAKGCQFERCVFTRLGGAGLDIEQGSQDNTVSGCHFYDISGSAVQIGDVTAEDHHPSEPGRIVKNNQVINCYIHDTGVEYQDSIGVFAGYTNGTVIAHNEIAQLPYSGVSVGWGWGEEDSGGGGYVLPYRYESPTPAGNNRIEANHIHHVMLSRDDGGGIYTLSNQPDSVIRNNYLHDNGPGIPGGIYLDEGSGFIEITGNVVHDVKTAMNYNNRTQDRITTCNEHDNFFEIAPDAEGFPKEVAEAAGLEPGYKKLYSIEF